jgi:NAD(P)-dependent dehydrogenase (short-subunit alcohol dehydrogenase family)
LRIEAFLRRGNQVAQVSKAENPSTGLTFMVTGTSSGIGHAFSKLAVGRGARVFGTVRNQEDAAQVADELGPRYCPLICDVRDEKAVADAAEQIRSLLDGKRLSGLVNNAAVAIPGPLMLQPLEELRAQLETDLVSLFIVTKALGPLLGVDPGLIGPPGRIVNMSSIGGKLRQPFATAYIASKHGVEGFTGALRRELQVYGIHVSAVAPGLVSTQVWDKVAKLKGRYDGTAYEEPFNKGIATMVEGGTRHGISPDAIAKVIWQAMTDPHPKLRYRPSNYPILEHGALMALPKRAIDWALARGIGLRRRGS